MKLEEFVDFVEKAYNELGRDVKCGTSWAHLSDVYAALRMVGCKINIPEFKIMMRQLFESNTRRYEMSRGTSIVRENNKYGFVSRDGLYAYLRIHFDVSRQQNEE